ncbi:MAG: hypothetical protein ACUVTM_06305 [Candidatus Bathyarchaeia archaeon]
MTVPQGAIALWSGTLSSIPSGWLLCDGSNGTPNLIARFVRGAPANTEAGSIGGSDTHTHTENNAGAHSHTLSTHTHNHTTNSGGSHNHGSYTGNSASNDGGSQAVAVAGNNDGSHTHTVNSASHSHTTDSQGSHTHTINSSDNRPPFYEAAYIQAGSEAEVASGLIIIWPNSISSIPEGWDLCDGNGGRPDLRSKFIRGINSSTTNPGSTGGNISHTHTEQNSSGHSHTCSDSGSHYHTFNNDSAPHNHGVWYYSFSDSYAQLAATNNFTHKHADTNTTSSHNHNPLCSGGVHTHTVNNANNIPPYYDVAFIYNSSANSIPTGGVLIWTGLIANIPNNYTLCDGGNDTPDLRGRFVRGCDVGQNPGGTGGSTSHTHTEETAGNHNDHSQTSAGAHQHSNTDSAGAHNHGIGGRYVSGGSRGLDNSAGSHSHSFNNEGAHTHSSIDSQGSHTHTINSVDHNPAFFEVQFIMCTAPPATLVDVSDLGMGSENVTRDITSMSFTLSESGAGYESAWPSAYLSISDVGVSFEEVKFPLAEYVLRCGIEKYNGTCNVSSIKFNFKIYEEFEVEGES